MVEITGYISSITYHNAENYFTILRLKPDEEFYFGNICVKGYFFDIKIKQRLKVCGEWVEHPKYGKQLDAVTWEEDLPVDLVELEKYLRSGIVKGIGSSIAKKMVDFFGDKLLPILKETPEQLVQMPGIGAKKAKSIAENFREQIEIHKLGMQLLKYGISKAFVLKIYLKFKEKALAVVKNEPYTLCDSIAGIGFEKADNIALKVGISEKSPQRIKSGLEYCLKKDNAFGHCFSLKENLIVGASKLLGLERNFVDNVLDSIENDGKIIIDHLEDGTSIVYLNRILKAEINSASYVKFLNRDLNDKNNYVREVLFWEGRNKIVLAEQQKKAVLTALQSGLMVLTGGPGTGKSTISKAIVDIYKKNKFKVKLAAPTGRAAKRLSEATGEEAQTIHRLLELGFNEETNRVEFLRNENNPIEADVIIIDEASMIDLSLFYCFTRAIDNHSRLILIGDVNQLPSVGAGQVLKDIIDSGKVPTVKLTDVYRQAQESDIIQNAHRILTGEELININKKDFFFIEEDQPEDILRSIISTYKKLGQNEWDLLNDVQILSPMKKSIIGVENLNTEIQGLLKGENKNLKEIKIGDRVFRQSDKVMQIRNNYKLELFNGDIGIISNFSDDEKTMYINFDDGRKVKYPVSQAGELILAYACTVHKSQGSQIPVVIIPLAMTFYTMLQKCILYTGITRAKKMVILIGQKKALYKAINTVDNSIRNTYLKERIIKTCS